MSTTNKDFKVKNGLTVADGGTFGGPVAVGAPQGPDDATTKSYVDAIAYVTGPTGPSGVYTPSSEPPDNPQPGDSWLDSDTLTLYVFYDGYWVEITGDPGPTGPTGPTGATPSLDGYAQLSGATFTGNVSIETSSQYPKYNIRSTAANGYGILSFNKADGNGFDLAYDNTNDSLAINRFIAGNYDSTPIVVSPGNVVTLPSTTSIGNTSSTEIGYLDGVTSSIQSQLDGKQGIVSGVSDTEIGYLDGVTSGIQGQINSKAPTASPTFTGVVTTPSIRIPASLSVTAADDTGNIQVGASGATNMGIDINDIQVRSGGVGAQLFINRFGGNVYVNDGADVTYVNRNGGDVFIGDSTVGLGITGGQIWATGVYGNALTTSYRSMYVSSSDTYDKIGYVASSRREKKNIEPLGYTAEQILSVEPVQYHYNTEDDSAPKHPGMIAEDLHDAGLHGFVSYDKEGLPASINYEFYVSALQQVVREQASQISNLISRVEALEQPSI